MIGNVVSIGASASATSVSTAAGMADVRAVTAAKPSSSPMSVGFGKNKGDSDGELGYWVDSLFRSDQSPAVLMEKDYGLVWREAARIFANGLRLNGLPTQDQHYLAQVIAKQTGLSPTDAEKRVVNLFTQAHSEIVKNEQNAKQTVDDARKLTAYAALWVVVALMSGAFVASLAATFGGRLRDRVAHPDNISFS